MTPNDASETLRVARARYFAENGLGDGGYHERWVRLQAGPLPLWFPNTGARVRAVRLHDLHHVLTGYATNWVGEAEIGAWELASGCGHYWAAWLLNGAAALIGICVAPRVVLTAWRAGRRCRNLYEGEWRESLLDETVGDLRAQLEITN